MDQIDLLAQWIIDNQSAKGTADFDVVVAAYEELRNAPAEEAVYDYGGDRPITDAFMPFRRKVLQEEQNLPTGQISFDTRGRMQQEIQNVPAKYGPAEYDLSYMPLVRGVKQAGEFLGDVFLGSNEEKAAAGEAVVSMAKAIPSMLTGQIEAANSETGVVYNPETGSMTEFDPFLALAGSSGLTRMPAAVTETGRMIRSARDSVSNIPERIRSYESPRAIEAAENMRGGGMTATRDSTAGYRLEEVIDGSNPEIPRLPSPSNSPDGAPDYITRGRRYRAVKDPVQKAAVRQGFDAGLVAMIRESSPTDRRNMLRSLNIMEESTNNTRFRMTARTTDVAGDSALRRYNVVKDMNQKAGKGIDEFAKANLKNDYVDFSVPIKDFRNDLDNMQIKLSEGGNLDFSKSSIQGMTAVENLFTSILTRMKSNRRMTAYEVHNFKRYLDTQVTYGKSPERGLAGDAERAIKSLRRRMDEILDNQYPEYDRLNLTYAESINALDDFRKAIGRTINLDERRANSAVGTAVRAVGSNRVSRNNLLNSLEDLDILSAKYGSQFDDDLLTQAQFTMELDKIFGSKADTSLAGIVEGAAANVPTNTTGAVAAAGKFAVNKLLGVDETKQFRAMEKLLKSFD